MIRWLVVGLLLAVNHVQAQVAIVTHDRAVMRNAARPAGLIHATLSQGELVEVRGERLDWLHVYDYRRERGGFVRASQVRRLNLTKEEAPELLGVVRFLRSTPNAEPLGIALASIYLQIAPAEGANGATSIEEGIEALDAIGTFADRLAQRATPDHMEVAARYGVNFRSVEREGRVQVCYDGEAFRRVLAMPSSADQRARAALMLTRRQCVADDGPQVLRMKLDTWRAEVLDKVEVRALQPYVRNRILMRRAGVWSSIAFHRARGYGEPGELAAPAAQRAIAELASVDRRELPEEDAAAYKEAAKRVAATRWAAVPASAPAGRNVHVVTEAGSRPGETCVVLRDAKPLTRRCTFGVVWPGSAKPSRDGSALTLVVQQTETHAEEWVFRRSAKGWVVRVALPRA